METSTKTGCTPDIVIPLAETGFVNGSLPHNISDISLKFTHPGNKFYIVCSIGLACEHILARQVEKMKISLITSVKQHHSFFGTEMLRPCLHNTGSPMYQIPFHIGLELSLYGSA